jgi:hypothetical protein
MPNFSHDSHQFYFERYLRNKLSSAEKLQLEDRLANDKELREAFEHYKSNRKSFLKELISEHDKGPKRSRLVNVFYLAITIIGISVALNYYLENRTLKEEINRDKKLIKRLVSHIPFVGKKIIKDTADFALVETEKISKLNNKTSTQPKNIIEELTASQNMVDTLLFDTIIIPIRRSYFDERLNYYLSEIDSTLSNVEIQNLVIKNSTKYDIKHKTSPINVAVWSANTPSYQFDGNNLKLNGISLPFKMLLVKDGGEITWLTPDKEIILVADNQTHTY